MLSREGGITSVGNVSNGSELSIFVVIEHELTLLLVDDVLESMGSGDADLSSGFVDEVVELGEVHKLELSWLNDELSSICGVVELVVSGNLELSHVVGISEGGELSGLVVKDNNLTSLGVVHVLELVGSLD